MHYYYHIALPSEVHIFSLSVCTSVHTKLEIDWKLAKLCEHVY